MKQSIILAIALLVSLLTPAVSGNQAPQPASPPPPNRAPSVARVAPDFELPALDGKPVRLSSMRGKIVLLEFTATWCSACYQAASDLRKIKRRFGPALSLISVSLDGGENTDTTREDLLRFVKHEKIDWPVLFDDTGTENSAAKEYGVERLPAYVLIDQVGIVRLITVGVDGSRTIEREVRTLMRAVPKT